MTTPVTNGNPPQLILKAKEVCTAERQEEARKLAQNLLKDVVVAKFKFGRELIVSLKHLEKLYKNKEQIFLKKAVNHLEQHSLVSKNSLVVAESDTEPTHTYYDTLCNFMESVNNNLMSPIQELTKFHIVDFWLHPDISQHYIPEFIKCNFIATSAIILLGNYSYLNQQDEQALKRLQQQNKTFLSFSHEFINQWFAQNSMVDNFIKNPLYAKTTRDILQTCIAMYSPMTAVAVATYKAYYQLPEGTQKQVVLGYEKICLAMQNILASWVNPNNLQSADDLQMSNQYVQLYEGLNIITATLKNDIIPNVDFHAEILASCFKAYRIASRMTIAMTKHIITTKSIKNLMSQTIKNLTATCQEGENMIQKKLNNKTPVHQTPTKPNNKTTK